MEVDANMVEDELSFMPGAASQTALSEWGFWCCGPCQRKGFWYFDEAAAVVKEQNECYTQNLCEDSYTQMQQQRYEDLLGANWWDS